MSFFKKIFSSSKAEPVLNEQEKQTLDKGLEKTKTSFFSKLTKAVAGKSKVDDEVLDNLEEILVSSDVSNNSVKFESTVNVLTSISVFGLSINGIVVSNQFIL